MNNNLCNYFVGARCQGMLVCVCVFCFISFSSSNRRKNTRTTTVSYSSDAYMCFWRSPSMWLMLMIVAFRVAHIFITHFIYKFQSLDNLSVCVCKFGNEIRGTRTMLRCTKHWVSNSNCEDAFNFHRTAIITRSRINGWHIQFRFVVMECSNRWYSWFHESGGGEVVAKYAHLALNYYSSAAVHFNFQCTTSIMPMRAHFPCKSVCSRRQCLDSYSNDARGKENASKNPFS